MPEESQWEKIGLVASIAEEIPSLDKAEDGGDFYVDTILGTYYLSMNTQIEPFNDINVRKALNLAMDRDYIANVIMQGTYSPAYNFMGPGVADAAEHYAALHDAEKIMMEEYAYVEE